MTFIVHLDDDVARRIAERVGEQIDTYEHKPLEGETEAELLEAASRVVTTAVTQAIVATATATAAELIAQLVELGVPVHLQLEEEA